MYLLNDQLLQPGDIVLMRVEGDTAEFIRKVSKSEYSHAMLFVDGTSIIDADGPGVHAHNPRRMLFKNENDAIVLRADVATKDILFQIEQFARSKVGTAYSIEEARRSIRRSGTSDADLNRQFCTRFVAQAYEYAGINIVEEPNYCTPGDIERSPLLKIVPNILRKATNDEITYAREENTPIDRQTEITNDIMSNVRNLSGEDIQTFEQIDLFAEKHPEMQDRLVEIFTSSGYLQIWKGDIIKNPWHYDFDACKHHYPRSQWLEVAEHIERQEQALFIRFHTMYDHFKERYSNTSNKFFKMMMELYEKLLELNQQRLTVAIDIRIELGALPKL